MNCYNNLNERAQKSIKIRLLLILLLLLFNIYNIVVLTIITVNWYVIVITVLHFCDILLSLCHIWYIIHNNKECDDCMCEAGIIIGIFTSTILYIGLITLPINYYVFAVFLIYAIIIGIIVLFIIGAILICLYDTIKQTIINVEQRNI